MSIQKYSYEFHWFSGPVRIIESSIPMEMLCIISAREEQIKMKYRNTPLWDTWQRRKDGYDRVCHAMAEIHSSIDIWSDRHGIQSVRPGISITFRSVFQLLFHSKSVLLRGKMYL